MSRLNKHVAILTVLGALAFASSASASTVIAGGAQPYQRWIDESAMPTPDVTLTVSEGDTSRCPTYAAACTQPFERVVWMGTVAFNRHQTFMHEVGHNLDYAMPNWVRERYMAIMHKTGLWDDPAKQHYSPKELFAESYALCALEPVAPPSGIVNGQHPVGGAKVHDRVCRLIERLAAPPAPAY